MIVYTLPAVPLSSVTRRGQEKWGTCFKLALTTKYDGHISDCILKTCELSVEMV